ncbi:MAG TPA: hypothetical protein V6C86_02450 [Oculatellaceae cyanobacterium]
MADKPTDSFTNQPTTPKPDASSPPHDLIKDRQAQAEQSAGAKLHEAAQPTDTRQPNLKSSSNNPLQGWTDFATHALQPLQKLRTDVALSMTHMSTDQIASQLPSTLITDLAEGKRLHDQKLAGITPTGISSTEKQKQDRQIAVYEQYQKAYLDKGLGSNGLAAAALDRGTMLDELNQSIAKRYKSERPAEAAALERSNTQSAPTSSKAEKATASAQNATEHQSTERPSPSAPERLAETRRVSETTRQGTDVGTVGTSPDRQKQISQESQARDRAVQDTRRAQSPKPSQQSVSELKSEATPRSQHTGSPNLSGATAFDKTQATTGSLDTVVGRGPQQSTRGLSERASDQVTQKYGSVPQGLKPGGIEVGPLGKLSASTPFVPTDQRPDQRQVRIDDSKTLTRNNITSERADTKKSPTDGHTLAADRTGQPPLPKEVANNSIRTTDGLNNPKLLRADMQRTEAPNKNQATPSFGPLVARSGESSPHGKTGSETQPPGLSKLLLVGDTKKLASATGHPSTIGERVNTVRGGIQKIDSARDLVQNAGRGTPYMARPLTIALPGASGKDGEKVLLSVRSSISASLPSARRLTADASPAINVKSKDAGASKPTPPSKLLPADASRRVGNDPSSAGRKTARTDVASIPNRRGSGDSATSEVSRSPYNTTFRANGDVKRYVLGTEIALTLILASAGIQRARAEQNRPPRADAVSTHPNDQGYRAGAKLTAQERVAERLDGIKLSTKVEAGPVSQSRRQDIHTVGTKASVAQTLGFRMEGRREPLTIRPGLSARHEQITSRLVQQNDASSSNKRHTFGVEIPLTMILASGGISRLRSDKANNKVDHASRTDSNQKMPETSKHGESDQVRSQRPAEQKMDAFLGKLREQLKLPENLKNQYEELTRRLTARPIPVYVSAHDGSNLTNWSGPALPSIEGFGTKSNDVKPNPAGSRGNQNYRFNRASNSFNLSENDRSSDSERDYAPTETEDDARTPVDESLHAIRRPTILVALNDTLISIAETIFHDPNIAWLILDLNRNSVKQSEVEGKTVVQLVTRQTLMLPVWEPDITNFYAGRTGDRSVDNLVTIVEETQLDKELMSSILGSVISEKKQNDTKLKTDSDDFQLLDNSLKGSPE